MPDSFANLNATFIQQKHPEFKPKIGLMLGSGSASLAEQIQDVKQISYDELQGFPKLGVAGHSGVLSLGTLFGVPVACLQGRAHFYEGNDNITMQTPIRTLRTLGCDTLLMTNAAGSLRKEVAPGNLVLIRDHINFSFRNPLVGPNDDNFGPRFPAMHDAYDADLRRTILEIAEQINIPMTEGVYVGILGPCYETPAEIQMYKMLGAEVTGMSTVPDVIVAKHCGLRVAVISMITNMAVGMSDEVLTHENVLKVGQQASTKVTKLFQALMENISAVAQ